MIEPRASADGRGHNPGGSAFGQRCAVWRAAQGGRRDLMRLSWNEVRTRAATFAEDWKDAAYEKGETQSFYNAFFDVFGVRRRNVARYEAHVPKLDNRSGGRAAR